MKEALRLYPVAPFQSRALVTDTNLGGYVIPGGVSINECRSFKDDSPLPLLACSKLELIMHMSCVTFYAHYNPVYRTDSQTKYLL